MSSTATTNLTISTLLDLIGPTAPPQTSGKENSAFDALLQAPQSPPPTRADEERPDYEVSQQRPERHEPHERPYGSQEVSSSPPASKAPMEEDSEQSADQPDVKDEESEPVGDEADRGLVAAEQALIAASGLVVPAPAASSEDLEPTETAEEALEAVEAKSGVPGKNRQSTAGALPAASARATVEEPADTSGADESREAATQKRTALEEPAPRLRVNSEANDQRLAPEAANERPATGQLPAATSTPSVEFAAASPTESPADTGHEQEPNDQPLSEALAERAAAPATNVTPQETSKPALPAAANVATTAPAAESATSNTGDGHAPLAAAGSPRRSRLPGEMLTSPVATAGRRGSAEVDSARLLTRVARALAAAQAREGDVRLRLSPPELGSLRVEIRVQEGAMVARLEAETEVARSAILDNLPALRERLAEQGVRIERFDVDLMQRQTGGAPNQSDQRQANDSPGAARVGLPQRRAAEPAPSTAGAPRVITTPGGLNVIV